ncbi:MAG: hypothetical protein K1W22_09740 [Lachnospiraceae bacterium]
MRRQRRDRHTVSLDRKRHLADLAESKPTASAARAFVRKAYECCNMAEYMARKYNIKGEIGIGEEGIGADKGLP